MNEKISWDDLRLFLAVADAGGLSAAEAQTATSAPTLGRRMVALEQALGRDLFHRHAKGYDLTDAGKDLRDQMSGVARRIEQVTVPAARPTVKISAGLWTTRVLCRNAAELAGDDVTLRFVAADHVLDISHREAVIGVRNQRPQQPQLAGQRIGPIHLAIYTAQDGPTDAPFVQVTGSTPSARWVRDQGPTPFEVTHPIHALDLVKAGVARAVLPCFIGDEEAGLQRIGGPITALTHDQWLVSHNTDRFLPAVRGCLDRLAPLLSAQSARTAMS